MSFPYWSLQDGDPDVTSAIAALKRPPGHGNLRPPCVLGPCSVPPTRTNSTCFSLSQSSCLCHHIALPFLHHSLFSLSLFIAPPFPSSALFPTLYPHDGYFINIYLRLWSEKLAWERQGLLWGSDDSLTGSMMTTGENCFVNCPISMTSVNTWAKKTNILLNTMTMQLPLNALLFPVTFLFLHLTRQTEGQINVYTESKINTRQTKNKSSLCWINKLE